MRAIGHHLRWGQVLISYAERTGSFFYVFGTLSKILRALCSLRSNNHPFLGDWVLTQFRHSTTLNHPLSLGCLSQLDMLGPYEEQGTKARGRGTNHTDGDWASLCNRVAFRYSLMYFRAGAFQEKSTAIPRCCNSRQAFLLR